MWKKNSDVILIHSKAFEGPLCSRVTEYYNAQSIHLYNRIRIKLRKRGEVLRLVGTFALRNVDHSSTAGIIFHIATVRAYALKLDGD